MALFRRFTSIFFILMFSLGIVADACAQNLDNIPVVLQWDKTPITQQVGSLEFKTWQFKGGTFTAEQPSLAQYFLRIPLNNNHKIKASLQKIVSEEFQSLGVEMAGVPNMPKITVSYEQERTKWFARINVQPIFLDGATYKRLTAFSIQIQPLGPIGSTHFKGNPTYHSKLENGDIYKFSIDENGLYKLDAAFLQELGIDVATINPKNIHLLGNGGERLPELIATERIDDLKENAIFIEGEADGSFDGNDFILFNAISPRPMVLSGGKLHLKNNPYTNEAFYFLKIDDQPGLRVTPQNSLPSAEYTMTQFVDCQKYEKDKYNLLDEFPSSEGGGNEWFGEIFKAEKTQTFDPFKFPHIVMDKQAHLTVRFAGYSFSNTPFAIQVGDENLNTYHPSVTSGSWHNVASIKSHHVPFFPQGESPAVQITFQANTAESKGWLDYIEINASRYLIHDTKPLSFSSLGDNPHLSTTFQLTNSSNNPLVVWDVSNPFEPKVQQTSIDGSTVSFSRETETWKRFIAFAKDDDFPTPSAIGKIENQNLHGISRADLIVLYHPSLAASAEKIATHRAAYSQLEVVLVNVEDVYNEFGSGALDPSAIRDFVKMVYDRDVKFRYLLLMGDASFDHKNNKNNDGNYNLIPVRETDISILQINTFPSDDFYALLSDTEGTPALEGALDIAVGRITARTEEEANDIVDKIIFYDTDPSTLKPWRISLMSIGDDDDTNNHMRQASEVADEVDSTHPIFNSKKILLDAYSQVPAAYGDRFPEATKQINDRIKKGTLIMNYFGHGGANGLAQERVLTLQSIAKWSNIKEHLPLVITASCSTAGFDDPSIKTFGEELLKNPTGGAIALFSTVRPVYASSNEALIDATYPQTFIRDNGKKRAVGEILRIGKNNVGGDANTRKFLLLGDPSMPIAIPDDNIVVTDSINGLSLSVVDSVPIQPLTKVTIKGHVDDNQGQLLTNFNGKVYVTIFDKVGIFQTLGQDYAPYTYKARKGILFKGVASVINGHFVFSFVMPKDVVSHGYGKISYYASDLVSTDAAGYEDGLYIGGGSGTAIQDDEPPIVSLYMNDESFVSGGVTNTNPTIFAKISDDNGINISGSGVGHDLTATIDGQINIANDYYESNTDDYTHGEMHYPLDNLEIGEHTIEVKAWDVANNSGTDAINFVVAESGKAALGHVLNYPNPFTDNTNFQFEHNFSGPISVRVDIYSVDGQIIKTIDKEIIAEGFRVNDIAWDGKDEYGDQLAKGVYLYRIKIRSEDGNQTIASDFEKLVILK